MIKLLTLILVLHLIETNQQLVIPKVSDCNIFCNDELEIDFVTCTCVQATREYVNNQRSSKSSYLIRGDKFATQASSDRCNSDEYWNGNICIPLISLCPGGYHWNGHNCIIQTTIQTAALVPSPPDTKCPYRSQQNDEHNSNTQMPSTVMPTYSTSPMCPFGSVWSDDKCVRNPPSCPSGYIYRANWCHLMTSTLDIAETTTLPSLDDILDANFRNGNKWQQKPLDNVIDMELTHNSENTALEINNDKMISNDQIHKHCCSIMSPRLCRRIKKGQTEQWQCYHHKSRRCSEFCGKPNVYLRPKKFSFVEPILIMPPPPRRLQKLMQNSAYRETNIGKK